MSEIPVKDRLALFSWLVQAPGASAAAYAPFPPEQA